MKDTSLIMENTRNENAPEVEEIKTMENAWSDESEREKNSLKNILKPMLYCAAVSGIYNFKDINKKNNQSNAVKNVLSNMYRTLFFIGILLFLGKFLSAFFYLPKGAFLFNVLVIGWLFMLLSTYLVFMKATSEKFGNLEKAFQFWDNKILKVFEELGIKYPCSSIRLHQAIVTFLSIFLIAVNMGVIGVQVHVTGGAFYTAPFECSPYTLTMYFILQTLGTLIWILPAGFVLVLTKVTKEAFNTLNAYGASQCKMNACRMFPIFPKVRLLHMDLCKLVSDLDNDLQWFYGTSFAFGIGLSVFTLYQVVMTVMSTFQLVMFLFWFFSSILYIGLIATYASLVHEAAHAPLDTIYYINVQDITVEKLAQLNLFLSKLTGTQVGFSTCGLLIITKEFILTIAGLFLTYFAVLYTL